MGSSNLKVFTCPVDTSECPSGSQAELKTYQFNSEISKQTSWGSFDITETVYCKYLIKHGGSLTSDRFKFNKMNIKISQLEKAKAYFISIPSG